MRINPIQFNFDQSKPQNTVSCPLCMNNGLQADTVSFLGVNKNKNNPKDIKMLVPKHKGVIYKKVRDENGNVIKKEPVEVDIIRQHDAFCFVRDGEVLGYVMLDYVPEEDRKQIKHYYLYRNYKKEGITGDRIIVDYLKNMNEYEYGGIGHLADLLEVAVCKELGIKPNVVSESFSDATPMHYKRGKRFVPYEKYVNKSDLKNLKGQNPNESIKEEIEKTLEGEEFDTPDLYRELVMYMPKSMAKELEEELKEHPIF